MEVDVASIRTLVEEVLKNIDTGTISKAQQGTAPSGSGIFTGIEEAIGAAKAAQRELTGMTLEVRRGMIRNIREAVLENLETLSRMGVEETGFGRISDKIAKNRLAASMTPGVEDLEPITFTDDHGLTLTERAPYGTIGAIAPSTNPTETLICNTIGMVAGGNSVVFAPHPSAKAVSCYTISLINGAIRKAGGPHNLVTSVAEPTIDSAKTLMNHPDIALLAVTGGPGVVREALKSTKKVIAAGPGNPPVVVDETADLVKAARDIVNGAGMDNNIICIDEKEILAVDSIVDGLKEEMKKCGAYELNTSQIEQVTAKVIAVPGGPGKEGSPNKSYVGKDAAVIAREVLGIDIPEETRILLCEVKKDHPLVWTEQLMPVIPIVRMPGVDEAIDFAVECEHGFRHTASMHSTDITKLSRMARVINCSLFVKNGSNYNGMGFGGSGYTSFTIASPTGEGFTRARTFTRERRCALIDSFRIV